VHLGQPEPVYVARNARLRRRDSSPRKLCRKRLLRRNSLRAYDLESVSMLGVIHTLRIIINLCTDYAVQKHKLARKFEERQTDFVAWRGTVRVGAVPT
jgi:hypothetical protein